LALPNPYSRGARFAPGDVPSDSETAAVGWVGNEFRKRVSLRNPLSGCDFEFCNACVSADNLNVSPCNACVSADNLNVSPYNAYVLADNLNVSPYNAYVLADNLNVSPYNACVSADNLNVSLYTQQFGNYGGRMGWQQI
jgi:hypothetical protein